MGFYVGLIIGLLVGGSIGIMRAEHMKLAYITKLRKELMLPDDNSLGKDVELSDDPQSLADVYDEAVTKRGKPRTMWGPKGDEQGGGRCG